MKRHTKIICTIGPSCSSPEKIHALIDAGMNVARLNFSHGTHEEHEGVITLLKEIRALRKVPLAIMLDTKGPEIRIGKIQDEGITLVAKDTLLLTSQPLIGHKEPSHFIVSITPKEILHHLIPGMRVLIDNGYISCHVIEKTASGVVLQVDHGGHLTSQKGVNIPNSTLRLPAITEKDYKDILFACRHKLEIIAASFIRSKEDVASIRKILHEENNPYTMIFSKIENQEGITNFDTILTASDGIMIARGDLGVELPLRQVPRLQKMMIRKSLEAGKPIVTATQMLETMIHQPRPTRAEVSDVANAIYDSTSSVMLAGETAAGHFPQETVEMMSEIIEEAESDFDYKKYFENATTWPSEEITAALTLASVRTAYSAKAKAIIVFTTSGKTARLLSRFRPHLPIIAITPHPMTYHQLASDWGIFPLLLPSSLFLSEALKEASDVAMQLGYLHKGDLVVVTAGDPFGITGTTNMMLLAKIGEL